MKTPFTLFILSCSVLFASAQTWYFSPANNGRDINCIKLFNRDSVIVAGGWELPNGDSTRSIFKSENGGLYLWNVPVDDNRHWIKSMEFFDYNNGIAVADGGQVIKTTDSGWNWTAENGPVLRDYNRIFFIDNQNIIIVGGIQKDSINPEHRQTIIHSTNGGQTWNLVRDQQGAFCLKSVYFINPSTGYAVGDSGTILKSANGGTNWTAVTPPIQRNFNAIWFRDANNGFIAGGYPDNDSIQTLLQTTDGGNTWTINEDHIGSMLRDIHFADALTGYAVGDDATVLKTTDGGQSWVQITIPGTLGDEQFNAVRFYSADFGYISGKGGVQYVYNEEEVPEVFTSSVHVTDSVLVTGLLHTRNEVAGYNFQFSYASDLSSPFSMFFDATTRNNTFEEVYQHIPLTDFDADTTVYVAIYAYTMGGKTYGDTLSFVSAPSNSSVQTLEATNVTDSTAQINGSIRGYSGTVNLSFQYGTTPALGGQVVATPASVTDTALQTVSANLANLQNHTVYYYRLRATTNTGTFYGTIRFFYTGGDDSYTTLNTLPATNIIDTGAVLNGIVSGFKIPATIRFDVGSSVNNFHSTQSYLNVTDSLQYSFSAHVHGLQPNTLYYARIKAQTQLGTFYGDTVAFYTLSESPFVQTLIAANVTTSSAQLLGQIQQLSIPIVSTAFEYGLDMFLGNEITASPATINDTLRHLIYANLSGLNDNTLYYYRLKAVTNTGAILYGEIKQVFVGIPSIPNWDFQDWTDTTAYISDDWVMLGDHFGRVPGHTGNYAMEIHAPGIITLGIFGGITENGLIFMQQEPFPYNPDSVVFWAKCSLAPNDTAIMFLVFTANDTLTGGYEGRIPITNTGGVFQRFAFPVRSMQHPDSMGVFIAAGTPGTSITIDGFTFTSTSGSTAFPVYDFEDWFDYNYLNLDDWKYLKFGATDTIPQNVVNLVSRTYYNQPDDYAAEIRNADIGGGLQAGEISNYLGIMGSPLHTIPIHARHRALNGYFQYYPENGDSLSIFLSLVKNGQQVAEARLVYGDTISEFRPFELPIIYFEDTSGIIPDHALLIVSAMKDGPRGDSRLIIDKLSFDGYRGSFAPGVGVPQVHTPEQKMILFPNPATSAITIQLETEVNEVIQLNIYGMDGKRVYTRQFPERTRSMEVEVKDFSKGLYVAQVFAGDKKVTSKFIVLK